MAGGKHTVVKKSPLSAVCVTAEDQIYILIFQLRPIFRVVGEYDFILQHLTKAGYSAADVRDLKESKDISDWNAGRIPIALIHPASAGHGLNIQSGGHILIWFGLTWSLELYQQTNARLWRQGQSETVTIHHIVTKDTVDEDVLAALASKDVTQEKLIAAVKAQVY